MAIFTTNIPRRKGRPSQNAWDAVADYKALKSAITAGQMKPGEQRAMEIDEAEMGEELGMLEPARSAAANMRKFIRKQGLEQDYWAEKYQTAKHGVLVLVVTRIRRKAGRNGGA